MTGNTDRVEDSDFATKEQNTQSSSQEEKQTRKKLRSQINYPPYVSGYGAIGELFPKIIQAAVPPKFTQDFMQTVLGMKSSSHRALIPLLKKLGFLDQANIPTDVYRLYRDSSQSQKVMAEQIRKAYADIYQTNEYAHDLDKEELTLKLRTLTGAAEDDRNIKDVASTFLELRKLSNFDIERNSKVIEDIPEQIKKDDLGNPMENKPPIHRSHKTNFGISYTINLNLPATTDIEVFNAIFKSLRENILDE